MLDVSHLSSFNKQDLLECGYGNMFGPGGAHLPIDEMLMIDRITSITTDGGKSGKGQIIAELDIDPDLWFFNCHFVNGVAIWSSFSVLCV